MSVPLIRSPESLRDVASIVQYMIDDDRPKAAVKFGKAVMKTLNFLAEFPEIGSPWEANTPRLQGVRFQNVRGFRHYLIFYCVIEAGLYVMRVIDGRRNLERIL
jgi:plasmid stabilization system protein ParE